MSNADLSRSVIIHICKDGTVTYRRAREKVFNGVALPFFTVNSEEEAKQLQISLCSRQYTSHPKQPNRPWYVLPRFGGELKDIDKAAAVFRTAYAKLKQPQPA